MKDEQIFLDFIDGREAAVLLVGGKLEDLFLETNGFPPGTIFRAKVSRPVSGQRGVFVSFPGGTGFLRNIKHVSTDRPMLVQVSGYAEKGKATPVTAKLLFKSRYAIITPDFPGLNLSRKIKDVGFRDKLLKYIRDGLDPLSFGVILRSSCETANYATILQDAINMRKVACAVLEDKGREPCLLLEADGPHRMAWREWIKEASIFRAQGCLYQAGGLDLLDSLKEPKISMGVGSYFIEQTRALTSVDVNTGIDNSLAAGLKANIAMAQDLPRQLRLRGIGGQIVIDPAPMPKKDRKLFDKVLETAFRKDSVQTQVLGWTALGLIELQRARVRAPLKF